MRKIQLPQKASGKKQDYIRKSTAMLCLFVCLPTFAFSQTATIPAYVAGKEKDNQRLDISHSPSPISISRDIRQLNRGMENVLPPKLVDIPAKNFAFKKAAHQAMEEALLKFTTFKTPEFQEIPSLHFKGIPLSAPILPDIRYFMEQVLIPTEAKYFEPGVGMDEETGLPYDHIRYRLKSKIMSERGNYTAASKLSLSIPFLLKIIQRKPGYQSLEGWTVALAHEKLIAVLKTLHGFNRDYPNFKGFLPWVDIRPNGTIGPANEKIPSLDNGQLTWALAAVVSVFDEPQTEQDTAIKRMAEELLRFQNYHHFYDEKQKLLHGTVQVSHANGQWIGDQSYYLNDMFEGTMAVLWGVLHGQIPVDAWMNLKIPTIDYQTMRGDKVTTIRGFRSSFHEWWALAYLPYMKSSLAPLLYNYLHVQADHSVKNKLPGFTSTAFDAQGVYRQMGIPDIANERVDREDVSVVFGTAMSMLISPSAGSLWLKSLYDREGLVTSFGAVESLGPDGFADIFTADGKGMTLLSASGGVNYEIEKYLKSRRYLDTRLSMYEKLMQLFDMKYQQMLSQRGGRPVLMAQHNIPLPPLDAIRPKYEKPPTPGDAFDLSAHMQPGHLHGKNVTSVGEPTLEDDLRPGGAIKFDYEIPPHFIYFDQWAFRGTYLDKAVRIADMKYLIVEVPELTRLAAYEIELKSDDITLASAVVRTVDEGNPNHVGSKKTKTLVYRIHPIPEADYKALNYLSISLHDPRYLNGNFKKHSRRGRVVIHSIRLAKEHPFGKEIPSENAAKNFLDEVSILKFWRLSHGDMIFKKNPWRGSLIFEGGRSWRGGYVPYTDVRKYRYMYLKIRNRSESCNCFDLELKNELNQLLGKKVSLILDPSGKWQYFEIQIPEKNKRPFNYMAISDAIGKFEIGSAFLSERQVTTLNAEKIDTSGKKKVLRCEYQCSSALFAESY